MSETIRQLEKWYRSRCDGEWEHAGGVKIDTLDNPGWTVAIDVPKKDVENGVWDEIRIDRAPDDWMRCWQEGPRFRGCGDPGKLEQILDYFLSKMHI